jgi:hypothetical protein
MPTYHSLAYLLNQAELVDGFLAWDFDADTAATFFAQQVYTMLFLSFLSFGCLAAYIMRNPN